MNRPDQFEQPFPVTPSSAKASEGLPALSLRERMPRRFSHFEPLNCRSRRQEAHSIWTKGSQSLLLKRFDTHWAHKPLFGREKRPAEPRNQHSPIPFAARRDGLALPLRSRFMCRNNVTRVDTNRDHEPKSRKSLENNEIIFKFMERAGVEERTRACHFASRTARKHQIARFSPRSRGLPVTGRNGKE